MKPVRGLKTGTGRRTGRERPSPLFSILVFLACLLLLAGIVFPAPAAYPKNEAECKAFCKDQYMALLVSGIYAMDINYTCSYGTGSCEFGLIAPTLPPYEKKAPKNNSSENRQSRPAQNSGPPASGPNAPESNRTYVSSPLDGFEGKCPDGPSAQTRLGRPGAVAAFEVYDAASQRALNASIQMARAGEEAGSAGNDSEFALEPSRPYYAYVADNERRYFPTMRNFTVQNGTRLSIRMCLNKAGSLSSTRFVGPMDFVVFELGNFYLPSLGKPGTVERQHALRISSSVPDAFSFREGRAGEFYVLPSGQYFAGINKSLKEVRGFAAYSDGHVAGYTVWYLNKTGYAPSALSDSGWFSWEDRRDGEPLAGVRIDTDYSHFYSKEYGNESNKALSWMPLLGAPAQTGPALNITPGFVSPSGLRYHFYSPARIELMVPLYAEKPAPEPAPAFDIAGRPVRGAKNATLTIVEFADFLCPFSKKAAPLLDKILADYDGKVNLAYKHYLVRAGSRETAIASECAADQGRFWEYHDALYVQPAADDDRLKAIAQKLNLDMPTFRMCLATRNTSSRVDADVAGGEAMGIYATPTLLIGQRKIIGIRPYDELAQDINEELAARANG